MKCEICGNEYSGEFCDKCGWEEINILDDEYLEIFKKRKEIYKKRINEDNKFKDFIEKLIEVYNRYINSNLEIAKVFIDDMVQILKNIDNYYYYIEFLLAKFYIYTKEKDSIAKDILRELENLKTLMDKRQLDDFEKLKAFYGHIF